MPKKTDAIIYSAVSDSEDIVRFAAAPVLDGKPWSIAQLDKFPVRAVYSFALKHDDDRLMRASCRSPGDDWQGVVDWIIEYDDGWLEWLLEGERK
jgi:hypothetical protein